MMSLGNELTLGRPEDSFEFLGYGGLGIRRLPWEGLGLASFLLGLGLADFLLGLGLAGFLGLTWDWLGLSGVVLMLYIILHDFRCSFQ